MLHADGIAVSVAAEVHHHQTGVGRRQTDGNWYGASVLAVVGVYLEHFGLFAGAPDPGEGEDPLQRDVQLIHHGEQHLLEGGGHAEVPAAAAPPGARPGDVRLCDGSYCCANGHPTPPPQ